MILLIISGEKQVIIKAWEWATSGSRCHSDLGFEVGHLQFPAAGWIGGSLLWIPYSSISTLSMTKARAACASRPRHAIGQGMTHGCQSGNFWYLWGVTELRVYMVWQVTSNRIYPSNIFISSLIHPVTFNIDVLITVNFICCIYIRGYRRTNRRNITQGQNQGLLIFSGGKREYVFCCTCDRCIMLDRRKTSSLSLLGDLVWFKEMCEPRWQGARTVLERVNLVRVSCTFWNLISGILPIAVATRKILGRFGWRE